MTKPRLGGKELAHYPLANRSMAKMLSSVPQIALNSFKSPQEGRIPGRRLQGRGSGRGTLVLPRNLLIAPTASRSSVPTRTPSGLCLWAVGCRQAWLTGNHSRVQAEGGNSWAGCPTTLKLATTILGDPLSQVLSFQDPPTTLLLRVSLDHPARHKLQALALPPAPGPPQLPSL